MAPLALGFVLAVAAHAAVYRVSNSGATTWRPAVNLRVYADESCRFQIPVTKLGCSGSTSHDPNDTCPKAFTGGRWRPQCHACKPGEAWLEFSTDVEVKCINADPSLGAGLYPVQAKGEGENWNGGITVNGSKSGKGNMWFKKDAPVMENETEVMFEVMCAKQAWKQQCEKQGCVYDAGAKKCRAGKVERCVVEKDQDYYHNDMLADPITNVRNAYVCANLCHAYPGCLSWTWGTSAKNCWLKHAYRAARRDYKGLFTGTPCGVGQRGGNLGIESPNRSVGVERVEGGAPGAWAAAAAGAAATMAVVGVYTLVSKKGRYSATDII